MGITFNYKYNLNKFRKFFALINELLTSDPSLMSDEAKEILNDPAKRDELIQLLNDLKSGKRSDLKYNFEGEEIELFIDNSYKTAKPAKGKKLQAL